MREAKATPDVEKNLAEQIFHNMGNWNLFQCSKDVCGGLIFLLMPKYRQPLAPDSHPHDLRVFTWSWRSLWGPGGFFSFLLPATHYCLPREKKKTLKSENVSSGSSPPRADGRKCALPWIYRAARLVSSVRRPGRWEAQMRPPCCQSPVTVMGCDRAFSLPA